jgi:uncharacterized SAM-binding protein YcdF (DUF218 family)
VISLLLIVIAVAAGDLLIRRRARWPCLGVAAGLLGVASLLVLAAVFSPGTFELRKFAGLCLMPAGLVWLAVLLLARVLAARRLGGFAAAAAGVWILLTLAGNAWLGGFVAGWLQRGYTSIDPFAQGTFDAVVVLGGGVDVSDEGVPMLTAAGDRVVLAARLYRAGHVARLVTTGQLVVLRDGRTTSDAAATATIWRQLGVPAEHIVLLEGPRSTTDEILAVKPAVAQYGWHRVGVLTSAWHLRRAMRLCARYGVAATPLPADVFEPPRAQLRWLVPQQLGFWRVQVVCWELLGALVGR